jgi:hypothetical protein
MTVVQLRKKPDMKRTAIYMPNQLYKAVEKIAVRDEVSVNSAMVQLLEHVVGLETDGEYRA